MDPRNPDPETRSQILEWKRVRGPREGLTCPCGFKGHTRNIIRHRQNCPVWEAMAHEHDWPKNQPNTPMKFLPPYLLIFDVEALGLHGPAIAVAGVVMDTSNGGIVTEFAFHRKWTLKEHINDETAADWVTRHVTTHTSSIEVEDEKALREAFWMVWRTAAADKCGLAAECAWPVEARFLNGCIDQYPSRNWDGPYPLHEISSFMIAAGMDPMGSYDRTGREIPAHEPLADAFLSASLMWAAIKNL
jgi:hypothetical protein